MKLLLLTAVGILSDVALHMRTIREHPGEFIYKWEVFVTGLLAFGGLFWAVGDLAI